MQFITNAGDQAVIIPIEAGVFLVFLLCRCWRMAMAWAVMIGAGSGLVLLLKLYLEACGPGRHRVLYSPSGHTMAATMVYGGLLSLTRVRRSVLMGGALAIAVCEGWTRVALGYHTVTETIVGGMVGLVMVLGFRIWTEDFQKKFSPVVSVLALLLLVAIFVRGWHPDVEGHIQTISRLYFSKWECKGPSLSK